MSVRSQEKERVPPILVTGVWRCGATLLYLLLNQHPDIALLYESDLPVLWPMFRIPWERKAWVKKWEYWNSTISRHDLDPARLAAPAGSLAEAFELAGRQYAAQQGKKRWGCKSPSYFDHLKHLAKIFPDAKFIVVWRDPEEICRSAINAASSPTWFARPGTNLKSILASTVLKKQVDALLAQGIAVHQIHYRDLVSDATNVMRGICKFLQVPFDPSVAVLGNADRSAVFKGAHHALARGTNIVSTKDRHKPLPPELASKIERYRALWKAENGDTWLLTRRFPEDGSSAKPTLWERAIDQLLYLAYRSWDIGPRMLFSMLPLAAWQGYRRLKYKDAHAMHHYLAEKPATSHPADDDGRRPTGSAS